MAGGGWLEKLRIRLTSASTEVGAELGNMQFEGDILANTGGQRMWMVIVLKKWGTRGWVL